MSAESVHDLLLRLKQCVVEMEEAFEVDDEERQSAALTDIHDIVNALNVALVALKSS